MSKILRNDYSEYHRRKLVSAAIIESQRWPVLA